MAFHMHCAPCANAARGEQPSLHEAVGEAVITQGHVLAGGRAGRGGKETFRIPNL